MLSGRRGTPAGAQQGAGTTAWPTLFVVCMVSMLIGLNGSTINVALPSLTRHFEASHFEASWLVLSYMVGSTACLLLFGRISDIVDQRWLYLGGLALFTSASIACGLAPTIEWLIGLRILAAVAGAILLGNGATLIHAAFAREKLGSAMGFYAASFPVATLIGPTVAGGILEVASWRWVFWMNVPVGIVALIAGIFLLRRSDEREWLTTLDLPGNVLVMTVITLTTVGISLVSEMGWGSPFVYGSLLLALALLPILILAERRSRDPVIDIGVLRSNGVGLLLCAGFFLSAGRFPTAVMMSLYFQGPLSLRPVEAALMLLPMPIGSVLASMCVGALSRRLTSRQISMIGAVIGQVGVFMVAVGVVTQWQWLLGVALAVMGMGTGLFIATNATSLLESTEESNLGVVNGMRLAVQNTGNVIGLALALTILTVGLTADLGEAVLQASEAARNAPPEIIAGFGWSMGFLSAMGVVGTVFSIIAATRPHRVHAEHGEVHEPVREATTL